MLLRSSSTPILGSLLLLPSPSPSPSCSPSHHHHHQPAQPIISCHLSTDSSSSSFSCFRRARSEGNLQSLVSSDQSQRRATDHLLQSIPSFSLDDGVEQQEQWSKQHQEGEGEGEELMINSAVETSDQNHRTDAVLKAAQPPLFLARGLGIDRLGSGLLNAGGGGADSGGGRGPSSDLEAYYKSLVEENPSNALFLTNYAHFLYQIKGDIQRAEEYYSRAILAEPGDGEILSQYAKLVWELHGDEERASSYFEQAVQAAPNDSHILAAYAGFLWDAGDEDDGAGGTADIYIGSSVHSGTLASASQS